MLDGHRCGYVALAGRPNVGKSTLLNALIGTHLSIVTPKAQTTRERVSGILTTDRYQILFIDGPGLIEPRQALQESMRWAAEAALEEADVVTVIGDATRPDTVRSRELLSTIDRATAPLIVVVNKCDLVDADTEHDLLNGIRSMGHEVLAISALTGKGLDRLVERIVGLLPESPPLFPVDETATQSVRFFAQELVRETCMEVLREEVPYSVACRVEEFREDSQPVYVRVTVFVERESQKGIVVGKAGSTIKHIGAAARKKIERLIDQPVYLDLRVKVLAGWSRKPDFLRRLGYRVPPRSRGGQKN